MSMSLNCLCVSVVAVVLSGSISLDTRDKGKAMFREGCANANVERQFKMQKIVFILSDVFVGILYVNQTYVTTVHTYTAHTNEFMDAYNKIHH